MQKNDLLAILDGDLTALDDDLLSSEDSEFEIEVEPKHLRKMINLYLSNKIDAYNLSRWAEFLSFRGEYVCIDYMNDESADFYERMWDVINMISTPQLDGEITPDRVREYLKELDKYFVDETKSANDDSH
ncbi:MAG: hypothetical protein AB7I18_04830 [Candidatus Berkiella sp.]